MHRKPRSSASGVFVHGLTCSARSRGVLAGASAFVLALGLGLAVGPAAAWEPTQPVELVVPAGTGGGADQMARFIQKAVNDHKLMRQPIQVVNKSGNSGVEGLLYMKAGKGDPHRLVITLSNLFTSPLAAGVDFNWRDITPVQMLALDQFVLWVNATSRYQSAQDLMQALRQEPPGSLRLAGTGSKQEDQLISVLLETAASTRIAYVPRQGGGAVASALAGGEVEMTVNNPIEAEKLWREGAVRPLCVFDGKALAYPTKVAGQRGWADLPTCLSAGIPVQYLMMRGIFTSAGATPEQVAYYNQVLDKVRALPEWTELMARGAFNQTTMRGEAYAQWLDRTDRFHRVLMREAKFKAQPAGLAAAASASGALAPARN
jgi:putative tricarboxylic transport membrane protein